MRPPVMIITFVAGDAKFRHVVGRADVRTLSEDDLGKPTWIPVGQRSPMDIDTLKTAALNVLAEYVGLAARANAGGQPPALTSPAMEHAGLLSRIRFTEDGLLEIDLGRVK